MLPAIHFLKHKSDHFTSTYNPSRVKQVEEEPRTITYQRHKGRHLIARDRWEDACAAKVRRAHAPVRGVGLLGNPDTQGAEQSEAEQTYAGG